MILLPKYRNFVPNRPFKVGGAVVGEVKAIMYDLNMNIVYESEWDRNLVVNNGLDEIVLPGYNINVRSATGTSSTGVSASDTTIGVLLQDNFNIFGADNGLRAGPVAPDYEFSTVVSKRYGAGVGTGTIREHVLAFGANGTDIFQRIVLPVSVVKGADNIVDILTKIIIFPDLTDHISTAVFKGVTYDTITRVSDVHTTTFSGATAGFGPTGGSSSWLAYDGAIGSVIQGPSGGTAQADVGFVLSTSTYSPGDYFQDVLCEVPLDGWNLVSGIRCLGGDLQWFRFQTQFTEAAGEPNPGDPVPKDNTEIMDFSWRYNWGARP